MKFTTLFFLAAVAGALVYAEDASSDSTDADPAQEAGTSKPDEEISDPAASASPPETTTTAQETSAAVQGTAKVTSSRQELNPLSKSLSLCQINNLEKSLAAGPHHTCMPRDKPDEKQVDSNTGTQRHKWDCALHPHTTFPQE
ncbi:extracellular glycoprotein lacritin isoform X1 [Piliocolobus tephrosceles]|uniref:extracellular glycoprotein lacritin isoform X1 n=1 Tax=Piliocolobus tephrosceles TaxID=591936 RepID=UPI000C299303|nr:extracellular glycoprotein lacritin isoform X1 [Piliocolobus tephrosceles]